MPPFNSVRTEKQIQLRHSEQSERLRGGMGGHLNVPLHPCDPFRPDIATGECRNFTAPNRTFAEFNRAGCRTDSQRLRPTGGDRLLTAVFLPPYNFRSLPADFAEIAPFAGSAR